MTDSSTRTREPFAKIATSLPWHDKLSDIEEADRLAAFGLYAASVCFCQLNRTDGLVRRYDYGRVFPAPDIERIVGLLVSVGLFDNHERGFVVHDYLAHNKSKHDIEQEIERKRAAGQAGGQARAKALAKAPATAPAQAESYPESESEADAESAQSKPREEDEVPAPKKYANTLPDCLHAVKDRDGNFGDHLIMQDLERRCGALSATEWGQFKEAFRDGCLHGCNGNRDQAVWCIQHCIGDESTGFPGKFSLKCSSKGLGASAGLLKAMREDRREAPAPRKEKR